MKKPTLIDFLTRRVTRQEARGFERVLAKDGGAEKLKKFFDEYYQDMPDDTHEYELKEAPRTFTDKFKQGVKELPGDAKRWFQESLKGKDPMELTFEDIENLFKTYDSDVQSLTGKWVLPFDEKAQEVNVKGFKGLLQSWRASYDTFPEFEKVLKDQIDKLGLDLGTQIIKTKEGHPALEFRGSRKELTNLMHEALFDSEAGELFDKELKALEKMIEEKIKQKV